MTAEAPLRCQRHGAVAGWECTRCNHALCPDCVALKIITPTTLVACTLCGEFAEPLVRKRGDGASLAQRLPGAFLFPFRGEGLPVWLGIALWLWALSFLGLTGGLVGWSVVLGSLFGLTRSTARGSGQMELSDFQDFFQSVAMPVVRFVIAMVPAWGGALLAAWLHQPWLSWLSLGLAVVWSPTAYIGAATSAGLVDLLNPMRVLGASARLGKDLGVYVGALAGVAAVMFVSLPVAWLASRLWVPVLSGVLAQMALLVGPIIGARVAGLVLLLHGSIFGWGDDVDSYEPVLKGVEPRGVLPEPTRTLPAHLPESIELEPEALPAAVAGRAVDRFAALELNPDAERPPDVAPFDVTLLPSLADQSAHAIRRAMRAGTPDVALDGFRATGLTAAEVLTFDELLWLGQTAAAHIDYESAELAFRKATEKPADPEPLARAQVMLARLLAERLNRAPEARTWMERIVAEHPGTAAASYAERWLQRP